MGAQHKNLSLSNESVLVTLIKRKINKLGVVQNNSMM